MPTKNKQNSRLADVQARQVTTLKAKTRGQRGPIHLSRLLELVNLVPRDFEMPDRLPIDLEVIPGLAPDDEMRERLVRGLATLPDSLRAHLLEHLPNLYTVIFRYHEIREWRRNLREMTHKGYPVTI